MIGKNSMPRRVPEIAVSEALSLQSIPVKQWNKRHEVIIIVVIITWKREKPSEKNNSDITVIRASDSFKWVMFMQNFEHGVTVFNQ